MGLQAAGASTSRMIDSAQRQRVSGIGLLGSLLRWILGRCGMRRKSLPHCAASQETRMNTEIGIPSPSGPEDPTQLGTIRALMLQAAARGDWLTLTEIAEPTEFGEASISAQLRHLRKTRHGRYRVEKRRRRLGESEVGRATGLWEY